MNRYIPLAGATATVEFQNINDAKAFSRAASNPFVADDRSIFKVNILASDPLVGTVSLKIRLIEGASVRTFTLQGALNVESGLGPECGC